MIANCRMSRFAFLGVLVATMLAAFSAVAPVQAGPVYTGFSSGIALDGHDAGSYFEAGEPVKGSAEFTAKHNGATWHFASAANRDAFAANPEKYAPQYGGHCAWAASKGYVAKGSPDAWKIVDGKLYLNYDQAVQQRWASDIPGNISKADKTWPTVKTD
ncbi:YHS domain-containing (seleno)protein [Tepidamorphus sp. 3E244]|uniref:YHS domain-containing (seleno)protein n=1 Tax=Tepidamorphus sp. 3E244 TaxID=3385498 RepID=UPI0038FD084D